MSIENEEDSCKKTNLVDKNEEYYILLATVHLLYTFNHQLRP